MVSYWDSTNRDEAGIFFNKFIALITTINT